MARLKDLKVGTRLSLCFGVVLLLLTAIAIAAVVSMARLNALTEGIVKSDWIKIKLITESLDNTRASMARVLQIATSTDKQQTAKALERFDVNQKKFTGTLEQVTALIESPEGKALLVKAKAARDQYVAGAQKVLKLAESGRDDTVAVASGETYDAMQAFATTLLGLMNFQQKTL
jgi:methyl-accepting chemotaxis protein